jgi:hypothetical protein
VQANLAGANNLFPFPLSADKFGWPWLKIDEMLKPGEFSLFSKTIF